MCVQELVRFCFIQSVKWSFG